jgi:mannose-6-phosphate isomerase-like protein (cupin superfamily)
MTENPAGAPGAVVVDLAGVLRTVDQPWQPRTVATLNDYDVRVVRTAGEFTRHSHPETDELFLVLSGSLTIVVERPEGPARVELGPGQLCVVPAGTVHQPFSPNGAEVLLVEPASTVNTGDSPSHLTAPRRPA